MFKYKKIKTTLERKRESKNVINRYPNKVPIIVEKFDNENIPDLDKHKFIVPANLTLGQFIYVIRKRIKLNPEKALFIFINNILPPINELISRIYNEHKDEDGFLYIKYTTENTYG